MSQTEKKAGFGDVLRSMFTNPATAIPLASMVAAPLVGAGINAAVRHKSTIDAAKEKTVAYRTMLDLHPHLKKRDSAEVSRIYNSLHNVNPVMARDPLVAGAWVDNIVESKDQFGGSHQAVLNAVKDLSGIRSQMSQAIRSERGDVNAGQRFERLVTDFGSQIGKAYDYAERGAIEKGYAHLSAEVEKAEKELLARDQLLANKAKALNERTRELQKQDEHLMNLAKQLEGYKSDLGEKQASDQDLDRLFSDLGV